MASTPDLASEYIGFDTMFDGIDVNEDGKISLDALCIYINPTDPPPVDFKQTAIFYFYAKGKHEMTKEDFCELMRKDNIVIIVLY